MASRLLWGRGVRVGTGAARRWSCVRGRWATGGFTLIEVLVVVAIIALLVSILLPSLQRAREQTKRIVCATNMRTIHQAMTIYLNQNLDFFPWDARLTPAGHPAGANPWEIFYRCVQKGLPRKMTPAEIKEKYPLTTPSANQFWTLLDWYVCAKDKYYHTTSETPSQTLPDGTTVSLVYVLSYCISSSVCYTSRPGASGGAQDDAHTPWKVTTIKRQSDMVLAGEFGDDCARMGGKFAGVGDLTGQWELTDHNDTNNQTEHFQVQHLGGCNILYLDGHLAFHRLNWSDTLNYGLPPYPTAFITNNVDCTMNANGQYVDEKGLRGRPAPVP